MHVFEPCPQVRIAADYMIVELMLPNGRFQTQHLLDRQTCVVLEGMHDAGNVSLSFWEDQDVHMVRHYDIAQHLEEQGTPAEVQRANQDLVDRIRHKEPLPPIRCGCDEVAVIWKVDPLEPGHIWSSSPSETPRLETVATGRAGSSSLLAGHATVGNRGY